MSRRGANVPDDPEFSLVEQEVLGGAIAEDSSLVASVVGSSALANPSRP